MLEILKNGIGYLVLIYPDGSKRIIHTTLNSKILLENGATYIEGHVYDLDRKEQVAYTKNCKISITEERPKLEGVDGFVSQFI